MWPEIQASLVTGKRLKEVWEAARRDGLCISYPQFRVYVTRIRKREKAATAQNRADYPQTTTASRREAHSPAAFEAPIDPLQNIRIQLEKKRQSHFEYNPFPDPEDSIS